MSSWSVRGAVVLTAVGLALAGCTNSTDTTADSASPGAVVSASSTPEPTARPSYDNIPPENEGLEPPRLEDYPQIQENTFEGAEAAAEFFVRAQHHAYATGDIEPLREISSAECEACKNIMDRTVSEAETGLFMVMEDFQITRSKRTRENYMGEVVVVEANRFGVIDAQHGEERDPPKDDRFVFAGPLRYEEGMWKVRNFGSKLHPLDGDAE